MNSNESLHGRGGALLLSVCLTCFGTAGAFAADGPMRPMLFATESRVVRFDEAGNITLSLPSGMARDVWVCPNGNILFPFNQEDGTGGVREVSPDGKTAWEYRTTGYVLSCQPLEDGLTLVGAAGQCAVLVVNRAGEVVTRVPVKLRKPHKHTLTMARRLANGRFLVAEETAQLLREYAADGSVVWEYATPYRPFSVVRLANGNTLFSGRDGLCEVTPAKTMAWQLTKDDVKEMGPRWFAGIQVLPTGNIMVCNAGGKIPFYEVNREKQIVWQSPPKVTQAGFGHSFYLLDTPGTALK